MNKLIINRKSINFLFIVAIKPKKITESEALHKYAQRSSVK